MEVLNLCIGRKYKTRDQMNNEVEKTAWTRIGTMFIRQDEKTGQMRYSMIFDAYPAHGESINAFPKDNNQNQGKPQVYSAPNTESMSQSLEDQRAMPTEKELNSPEEEEVKIEDVPF